MVLTFPQIPTPDFLLRSGVRVVLLVTHWFPHWVSAFLFRFSDWVTPFLSRWFLNVSPNLVSELISRLPFLNHFACRLPTLYSNCVPKVSSDSASEVVFRLASIMFFRLHFLFVFQAGCYTFFPMLRLSFLICFRAGIRISFPIKFHCASTTMPLSLFSIALASEYLQLAFRISLPTQVSESINHWRTILTRMTAWFFDW